jgi:hypothetical protein
MSQLHKRLTSDQVKELLERYLRNELERTYIQEILGIRRRSFFTLAKEYRENPPPFTIQYERTSPPRIPPDLEETLSWIVGALRAWDMSFTFPAD